MKLKDFIVCDDIRFELGNKFSLIGTYFSRILVGPRGDEVRLPLMLKLGVLIRLVSDDEDVLPQEFRLRYNLNGKEAALVTGILEREVKDSQDLILPIVIHLPIAEFGKLSFDLEFSRNGEATLALKHFHSLDVILVSGKQAELNL